MQEPITLEVVVAVVVVLGFVASLWWVIDSKVNKQRDDLAAHKLHVAETYMSKASGGVAIDRNTEAVEAMSTALKAEIGRVETQIVGRIERMESKVFLSGNGAHKT